MKLFIENNTFLNELEQKSFKLEKDIQSLIEINTEKVFNLKFIESELSVGKYRLDTLCFDEENNSFVIIEYKKGSSYSVIDQGYTYLQLLLNNKSEFLLVLSQYFNRVLRVEDVDWSQSKIIFISPSFNSYQKDSVNFKGLPFELWEIKRFTNGVIVLNQHLSTSEETIESLNDIKSKNVINSVNREVKVYSIEDHISNMSKPISEKWNDLKDSIMELDGLELVPKRHYVGLVVDGSSFSTICYIKFRKNKVVFTIIRGIENTDGTNSENFFTIDDPKGIVKEHHRVLNNDTTQKTYDISLDINSDLNYVMFLLRQKYNNILN